MTNNHEDHEHDDFVEPEIGLSDEARRSSMKGNLAEAWRTRPLFKFMVLIGAVFAVSVAAASFFGGSNTGDELAHLAKPPSLKEAPGGAASPYMRQQTELANKERSDQAIANGGSAMPSPLGQATDIDPAAGKDTQLNELRAETESLKKQVQLQQQKQAQPQPVAQQRPPEQFDNSMAEAMQMFECKRATELVVDQDRIQIAIAEIATDDDDGDAVFSNVCKEIRFFKDPAGNDDKALGAAFVCCQQHAKSFTYTCIRTKKDF